MQIGDEVICVGHTECDAKTCLAALVPLMGEWDSLEDDEAYRDL
jgi:hypothetical protein